MASVGNVKTTPDAALTVVVGVSRSLSLVFILLVLADTIAALAQDITQAVGFLNTIAIYVILKDKFAFEFLLNYI